MQASPTRATSPPRMLMEEDPIFKEPPVATVVSVSRSEGTAFQLIYTIDFEYRQFKWRLVKKATQVFSLHSAIKIRALVEDLHEKQEQAREWFQSLGIGDHTGINLQEDEEQEQDEVPSTIRKDIPSSAALPVMRPALGRLPTITYRAQNAMQDYLKHFLDDLDIVNSREVCRFLEVSKLSFAPEYGPKLHEGYVMVQHLPNFSKNTGCLACLKSCSCCNPNWQRVWAVLKPGFLAILGDPFDAKPLDIIVFDVLPPLDRGATEGLIALARLNKERNPLRFSFMVTCGTRAVRIRTQRGGRAKDWVANINDAGLRPPEGWCHPHRFGSFAPPRGFSDGSEAQWFVDGKAAFEAIATAIENARSEIFIAGWWLCPDLYLRRPFSSNEASRLDHLLEAKAKMGVQIYILLYKEVALALKINSNYTKQKLLGLHENIKVLRFPDHFSSGVYLWSHHEKFVIVDHHVCFLGGLDLCFGRYDSPDHRVSDYPSAIWPGKDYYNPRESEPNSWEDTMKDELDRQKVPRMPWHDVHCALWGPPCRDVARHFVQRWNYAKRSKAPNENTIPLLLPQHHMVIPHYLTGNEEVEAKAEVENELQRQSSAHSQLTSARSSYSDIPLLLPKENDQDEGVQGESNEILQVPRHPSISSTEIVQVARHASTELVQGIQRAFIGLSPLRTPHGAASNDEERALLSDVPLQAFVGDPVVDDESRRKNMGPGRPKKQSRVRKAGSRSEWWDVDEHELGEFDAIGEVGPQTSCRCQIIRSVGQWSAGTSQAEERSIHEAYCSLIEKAEYFVYIENQFFISGLEGDDTISNRVLQALYSRIMRAYKEHRCFRVIVVLPLLPGFQGGVDDGGAASVRAIMHWQYRTICRGKNSLLERLSTELGAQAEDYITFYGLRSHGKLHESGPLATSQIYVHSKIMIVDDWSVLIGSANINDRSLLGSRDSELAVVLEDNQFIRSSMNGKVWNAGRFAHSLRVSLWAEHLGLRASEVNVIRDPVCDATYKDLWISRARSNTSIYKDVFGSIPDDSIRSRVVLRQAISVRKDKISHNTIDLGISSKSSTQEEDCNSDPDHCIDGISGHLVFFPLRFMAEEDLRPVFKESEYYASSQIFH